VVEDPRIQVWVSTEGVVGDNTELSVSVVQHTRCWTKKYEQGRKKKKKKERQKSGVERRRKDDTLVLDLKQPITPTTTVATESRFLEKQRTDHTAPQKRVEKAEETQPKQCHMRTATRLTSEAEKQPLHSHKAPQKRAETVEENNHNSAS
jgi:hypothetical protein